MTIPIHRARQAHRNLKWNLGEIAYYLGKAYVHVRHPFSYPSEPADEVMCGIFLEERND